MKTLTHRQQQIYNFLAAYIEKHTYPPTIRETAEYFGISIRGAHDHLRALEKKGVIRTDGSKSRTMELIDRPIKENRDELLEIPILGSVAAGTPLFAEENREGFIRLPASALSRGDHFALVVKGDSMIEAGILDGDTAIFCKKEVAANGDIIVARINDEAVTLKRYFQEKNRIRLQAENSNYPPLYTQSIKILGKLEFIYRHYD